MLKFRIWTYTQLTLGFARQKLRTCKTCNTCKTCTLSFTHSGHSEQPLFSCLCSKVTLTTPSLLLSHSFNLSFTLSRHAEQLLFSSVGSKVTVYDNFRRNLNKCWAQLCTKVTPTSDDLLTSTLFSPLFQGTKYISLNPQDVVQPSSLT